jgi:undecaprenyl-diphosphatase
MLRQKTGISLEFVEKDIIIYPVILAFQLLFILIDSKGFKNGKKNMLYLLMSLIITFLISTLFRSIIPRERPSPSPHTFLTDLSLDKYSFPSGHTSLTFNLFAFIKTKLLVWIWVFVSIFIMISRLWNSMHYPSDVIAGAVLGYAVPILVIKIMKGVK